ncbi:hypothetical protein [Nocardioides marmoribigeumensis]|uniref:WD40 repeat domain-containing protein n=1 Tax=Nocardioides marmoribigeumensis TaxID=433649 RepID=A0ABU2BQG6_9ACTN|nr:hypothetical protein [Nocardioides marmoribigeumensis]MDR7360858.1 hypothetical protein [Nocardioides marmoribigeumensis]
MRRWGAPPLGLALAAGLLVGCGDVSVPSTGEPRFDPQQVAWAYGRTLHYGDEQLTLPRRVRGLAVTDYGFFVELADDGTRDAFTTWGFFDGETWTALPGNTRGTQVVASPDGRYAGWVDQHGPLRPAGRIREVVVVDARTGETVLTDHSHMGGSFGDDLGDRYEELDPTFLGFDEDGTHAYWTVAEGSGTRYRADLATGEVEAAPERNPGGEFPEEPVSVVVDAYRGRRAGASPESGPVDLQYGLYSPDQRFAVDVSAPDRTEVFDASTGKRVPVDFPDRAQYFGGWLPDDSFYVVGTGKRIESYDPVGPDPTEGRVVVCRLPAGTCEQRSEVPGLYRLVVPGQPSLLG